MSVCVFFAGEGWGVGVEVFFWGGWKEQLIAVMLDNEDEAVG